MPRDEKKEPAPEQFMCLTLDEVNDLLYPLDHHAFGYSREGLRAAAMVQRMSQWRSRLAAAGER